MAVRIIWSRLARQDLNEIRSYIGRDNPVAANSVLKAIEEQVEALADFPQLGRLTGGNHLPPVRELVRPPYKIPYFFSADLNFIFIIRVWHSARGEPELEERG